MRKLWVATQANTEVPHKATEATQKRVQQQTVGKVENVHLPITVDESVQVPEVVSEKLVQPQIIERIAHVPVPMPVEDDSTDPQVEETFESAHEMVEHAVSEYIKLHIEKFNKHGFAREQFRPMLANYRHRAANHFFNGPLKSFFQHVDREALQQLFYTIWDDKESLLLRQEKATRFIQCFWRFRRHLYWTMTREGRAPVHKRWEKGVRDAEAYLYDRELLPQQQPEWMGKHFHGPEYAELHMSELNCNIDARN